MANGNFIVQNGLTVGPLTIDAATGGITTTGPITSTSGITVVTQELVLGTEVVAGNLVANSGTTSTTTTTGALVVTGGAGVSGNLNVGGISVFAGNVLPSANVTYSLGSRTQMWKDIFVGPGTLYINGKAVISDNSGTMTFTTDPNQNLSIQTSGTGDLQLNPTGTGAIALQNTVRVTGGKTVTTSDSTALLVAVPLNTDSISSRSSNTNLSISAQGTGKIAINNQITGGGTITFADTTVSTSTATGAVVVAGGVGVAGDLRVAGNVYSYGVLAVQSSQLQVNAPLVYLATSPYPYSYDIGSYSHYYGTIGGSGNIYQHTGTVRDHTDSTWKFFSGCQSEPTTTVNFSDATIVYDPIKVGGVTTTGAILPSASNVTAIGSSSLWFSGVYAQNFYGTSTTAKYADLAENYQADTIYPYGTVLMFGGSAEVTVAAADTTRVAGVVSQNPAHLMNGGLTGAAVVPLALTGRVPCNVIGPVAKGDLMVSAGFGYAKANNNAGIGQVIGKALADFPSATKGQIEVVVGRV